MWDLLRAHNRENYQPLAALCWLLGGLAWATQVLGVSIVVLWSHSLGVPLVGGVLGPAWSGVLELVERFLYISWHGDVQYA